MKIKKFLHASALLVVSIILFPLSAMGDSNNPLTGTFYGTASITSPANLGTIDLVFYLDVTGTAIQSASSYIVLEKTLLFPVVPPQVDGKDVGPRVSGTVSPASFSLTTNNFTNTIASKTVTRKITLSNAVVRNEGNSITGTFKETVTGMGKDQLKITGTFVLVKPVVSGAAAVQDSSGDDCIDLIEIRAGGNDPAVIEFSDISYAVHLYNNADVLPNLCQSKETVLQQALDEYYGTQK